MKAQEKKKYEFRIVRQFTVQTGNEIFVEAESEQEAKEKAKKIADEKNGFPEIIPDSNTRYIVDVTFEESSIENVDDDEI